MSNEFNFTAKVWLYPGEAAWHFITLPKDLADQIHDEFGERKRGWGSLRVKVAIGETTWETSIFPDKQSQSFLLPLKAAVRKQENIYEGKAVNVSLVVE